MEKIKVGGVVVSDLNHTNYGSALQAYATIQIIERMGGQLTLIKYRKQRSLYDWIKIAPGLMFSGGLGLLKTKVKTKLLIKTRPEYARMLQKRFDATNHFKEKHFAPLFKEYVGYKSLCEGSKEFDVVFVGSDQVWRPFGYYSNYWNLNFVDDSVPKFSYSSSYGVSKIPLIQRKGTKRYLERIDMISVREKKAKEIVESLSTKKAEVVADPTMLCTREEWLDFAKGSTLDIPSDSYMFCYFLGPRKDIRDRATEFARKQGLKIICMPHMEQFRTQDLNFGNYPCWTADAQDFVKIVDGAKYVWTDSFHGTVFSILLHKQFFTFYREFGQSTNSRIDSLLGIFGLQERLVTADTISDNGLEIDYSDIDDKLSDYRSKSIEFLKKALALPCHYNSTIGNSR